MATVTKKQLVERISMQTQQTKVATKEVVQLFLDTITEELQNGNRIELRDFGVFEVKKRASRVGRNPRTGDTVEVPSRQVVAFKVGRKMKLEVASVAFEEPDPDLNELTVSKKNKNGKKKPSASRAKSKKNSKDSSSAAKSQGKKRGRKRSGDKKKAI